MHNFSQNAKIMYLLGDAANRDCEPSSHKHKQITFCCYLRSNFYLREGGNVLTGVCLFACLSVCLLATSRKNYWSDFHDNFVIDASLDKKSTFNFGSNPHSGSVPDSPWRRSTFPECSRCFIIYFAKFYSLFIFICDLL